MICSTSTICISLTFKQTRPLFYWIIALVMNMPSMYLDYLLVDQRPAGEQSSLFVTFCPMMEQFRNSKLVHISLIFTQISPLFYWADCSSVDGGDSDVLGC